METTVAVADVRDVGPNAVAIEFETPDGLDAMPGQFVRLGAVVDGEWYRRFYTLSSPDVDGTFEVTVEAAPDEAGAFSEHLLAVAPGDELEFAGPFGDAHYRGEARSVVLAGGPGVGPAVGIGERALADGNEVAVVYRHEGDPVHRDRLDAVREAGGSVALVPPAGEDALSTAVADALTGHEDETVFVYGFQPFVTDALDAVESAGGDPESARVESFG